MKKLLHTAGRRCRAAILFAALAVFAGNIHAADLVPAVHWFYFEGDTSGMTPDTVIFERASPSVDTPPHTWPVVAVLTNFSLTATNEIEVSVARPVQFFCLSISNAVWGESFFEPIAVRALPQSVRQGVRKR